MALNNYTKSSRFTTTTTPVTGNGETASQRNEKKYREYQAKKQEREKLVSAENKLVSSSQKDIANYDKFVKDFNKANPGMDFEKGQKQKLTSNRDWAGGVKKVGPEALKRYNEMERSEGLPVVSELYRPGDFKDDDAFVNAFMNLKSKSPVYYSKYKRPSKYKPKTYPEVAFPEIEEDLDRMKVMPADFKTRRQKARNIELSGQSGPEYSDPRKPSSGKKPDVFKGQKIKYAKKASSDNKKGSKGLGYKTEERLAKATYARGLEGTNLEGLSERKGEAKYERRRALATGNISAAMDAGREVRDVRKAERYRKSAMGEGGARMSGDIDRSGALKYFTPERMEGFRDSKDNPLNRNRRS
jgi:hypothetical protein